MFEPTDVPKMLARREKLKETHKNGNGFGLTLAQHVQAMRMLPTPRTTDVCSGRGAKQINGKWYRPSKALEQGTLIGGANLSDVAEATGQTLPTPTARDWKDNGTSPAELSRNSKTLATVAGGKLNPTWVEWLMGWPLGWTDCAPLATDKWQSWLRAHGDC
jgi:hypothetical protein